LTVKLGNNWKNTLFLCTKHPRIWRDVCHLQHYKLSLWTGRGCSCSRVISGLVWVGKWYWHTVDRLYKTAVETVALTQETVQCEVLTDSGQTVEDSIAHSETK